MKRPNFLIIGSMKSGTSTLYLDIGVHPKVFVPEVKEPHALCDDRILTQAGQREYFQHFRAAEADQISCDGSTGYAKRPTYEGVANRARDVLGPDLKLIYIMRDPIVRLMSHHHHAIAEFSETRSIDEAVRGSSVYLDYSRYDWQLEPWVDLFGWDRIMLIQFEEYVKDRQRVTSEAWRFLGLDPQSENVELVEPQNKSEGKPVVTPMLKRVLENWAYRQLVKPLTTLRFRKWVSAMFLPKAPPRPAPPTQETMAWLVAELSPTVEAISKRMGRSEPIWDLRKHLGESSVESRQGSLSLASQNLKAAG